MSVAQVRRLLAPLFLAVGAVFVCAIAVRGQTADVQIIHNAADPSLRWLDIYVNNQPVVDSLLFRIATEYLDVPSGNTVSIGIARAGSSGPQDIVKQIPVNLESGRQYVLAVIGVESAASFKKNPDGIPTEVNVIAVETRNEAGSTDASDYLFINGTTDAPALSFVPEGGAVLSENVVYGSASAYSPFDEFIFTMQTVPTSGSERIIGRFALDVGFLQGQAFTVLTSGFISKFDNSNGPELKLMIVSSDGFARTIEASPIPESFATLQVINNSGDLDHPNGFDILFNGGRAVDDLGYRRATSAFAVPSGENLSIQVADSSGSQVFASSAIATEEGTNYLVMINGLVSPGRYAPNPDGRATGVSITINPNIRREPEQEGIGEFIFSNGVTDSRPVDLEVTGVEPVTALPLGDMTGYLTLTEFEPLMEMFRTSSPLPALFSHIVNIDFTPGKSFVIFASGFDNPAENRGGSPAQLIFALQDGAVGQLKAREETILPFSKMQLIHASADPSAQTADLYIDTFRVANDAMFRTGTPFFDVFTGKTVTVGVAPASSSGFREIVASRRFVFDEPSTVAAIARGVLNPESFAPNPDGIETGLDVHLLENVLDSGPDATQVTLLIANAVTDMQTVDVLLDDAVQYASNTAFSEASAYGLVSPARHSFDFRDAATGNRVVKSFVELFALQGRAGILVASGFIDTTEVNMEGPAFSTFLVLDDGSTRTFDMIFTSIDDTDAEVPSAVAVHSVYPNPFRSEGTLLFDLPEPATVSLQIFDVTGRRVSSVQPRPETAGHDKSMVVQLPQLPSGVYFYRLTASTASRTESARGQFLLVN
jgi:hypothetical protein